MVSDVNDGAKKTIGVTLTIMGTVIAIGVAAVFGMSVSTNTDQAEHETNSGAHGIDKIASDISTISSNVQTIMIQQGVQAETMRNMADDIAELKEK